MKIALKAYNQLFVCAELGGGIHYDNGVAINCNRAAQNIWEEFKEISLPEGGFALQTYSGNYVCAEDDKIHISTDRTAIGPWEAFKWVGNKIQTHHGTFLTARLDLPDVPLMQTMNQDVWEEFQRIPLEAPVPIPGIRQGIVRTDGRCAIDDTGLFHPLGVTFFWALYGWKFERDRIHEHLTWLKQYGFDYLRILGEVNWQGRSILPSWPDYENILREFVDTAYDQYGMRSEITLVGGKYNDHRGMEQKVRNAMVGAENKVMHYEVANEYGRLDKITPADLVDVGRYLMAQTPNLVALSSPDGPYSGMISLSQMAGVSMYTVHTRRSNHDNKWSHVRQGYDLKEFPKATSNNEPQGPQSSVAEDSDPLRLAMARATGIVCSGAFYVLHVGQGVTGIADPDHGRPQNMWEVPGIDEIMKRVRKVDVCLPQGIENWQVVNNGRSNHPLPLDPRVNHPNGGFWEGSGPGSVNKNYATISGNRFVEVLDGVKNPAESGSTLCGTSRLVAKIKATDVRDYSSDEYNVSVNGTLNLEGRNDTMVGYVLNGNI
jgi:hypothetical protein